MWPSADPRGIRGARWAPALLLLLLITPLSARPGAAIDLSTGDGLTLQLDGTGAVTGLEVGGAELLTAGSTGGFTLTDFTGLQGDNLVAAGGFEEGFVPQSDDIQVPAGWTLVSAQGAAGDIQLLPEASGVYEGSTCLRFVTTQSAPEDVLEVRSGQFAVSPGADYYCSALFRSPQGFILEAYWWLHKAEVFLDWYDASAGFLGSSSAFKVKQTLQSWTLFTGRARPPAGAALAAVRIRVSGNIPEATAPIEVLVDAVRCFQEPAGIRDIPLLGSAVASGGGIDLLSEGEGGRGLRLTARLEAFGDRIEVSGQVTPAPGEGGVDRAFDLSFVLPVDTSANNWEWYDGIRDHSRIQGTTLLDETVAADASSTELLLNVYNLSCIADPTRAVNLARQPQGLRLFHTFYDPVIRRYVIRFQMGLAPEHEEASFDFILYTTPGIWGFRGALQKYYAIYPEYGRRREFGGQLLRGGADVASGGLMGTPYEVNPEDFGIRRFHQVGLTDVPYMVDELGLLGMVYSMPWGAQFEGLPDSPPAPYSEYRAAISGEPSTLVPKTSIEWQPEDFPLNPNSVSGEDPLLYRVWDFPTSAAYILFGPLHLNPGEPQEGYGDRYLDYLEETYQVTLNALGGDQYMSGLMLDLAPQGSYALDGRRSRFGTAGYDLVYSPHTHTPALWSLNSFERFLAVLQDTLAVDHPNRDLITGNAMEFGSLFTLAAYLDELGVECSPVSGNNWKNKNLDYRRTIAGNKSLTPQLFYKDPLPFVEGEFHKGGGDLWNVGLLFDLYLDLYGLCMTMGEDVEQFRTLTAGVIPYIDLFQDLGWQPNHLLEQLNASLVPAEDLNIQIERYGPNPEVEAGRTTYIVVLYNQRFYRVFDAIFPRPGSLGATRDFRLRVHLEEMGLQEPVMVEELSATLPEMAPPVSPNLSLVSNGDGTCLITGTVAWRDALILKVSEVDPDTTPPAPPEGINATVLP